MLMSTTGTTGLEEVLDAGISIDFLEVAAAADEGDEIGGRGGWIAGTLGGDFIGCFQSEKRSEGDGDEGDWEGGHLFQG